MKYLGILFCLVFMSSCELTPEQQANWEKFDKKLDEFNEVVGESNDILNAGNPNYKNNSGNTDQFKTERSGTFQGEYVSGFNKICIYKGISGEFTKTFTATTICPLRATIEID